MSDSQQPTTAPRPKKGDILELTVDSLAYGGRGVSRKNGLVIFTEGTLPGEQVRARVTRRKTAYLEARVEEVLQQSPGYVDPPCEHFGICGGCRIQHYDYPMQLQQKQAQVEDLYRRIGGFKSPPLQPIIGCSEIFRYRNKMDFTFSNRPWRMDPGDESGPANGFALGLHVPGRYDKVLDIQECWLQGAVENEILQLVKDRVRKLSLEPYDVLEHTGFLRHLMIRSARATGEIMVNFVTADEKPQLLKPVVDEITRRWPQVVSIVNNINTRKAALAYGEWEVVLHGKPVITEQLLGMQFEISANSFFQTNTRQAEVLYTLVIQACGLSGREVVYDLYSGTGSIALSLAGNVAEVYGFELVQSAVDDAVRNALSNEKFNTRFFQGDLATVLTDDRIRRQVPAPDVLVTDPPRAGMHGKLLKNLVELSPQRIVYVSCNPATQVRDVRLLCDAGYRVIQLQPVDMFPHTPHIENICTLER